MLEEVRRRVCPGVALEPRPRAVAAAAHWGPWLSVVVEWRVE